LIEKHQGLKRYLLYIAANKSQLRSISQKVWEMSKKFIIDIELLEATFSISKVTKENL